MNTIFLTKLIIILTFLSTLIYNIIIKIKSTARDTISKVILDETLTHPSLAFVFGIMVGHWLWPMEGIGEESYWKYSLPILIPVVLGVILFDYLKGLPPTLPIFYFVIGVYAGHFGWTQRLPGS